MRTSRKALIALGAAALLLGGCATYDYDSTYTYDTPYHRSYAYNDYYGPRHYYYEPYYVAPSIGFGLTYRRDRWR